MPILVELNTSRLAEGHEIMKNETNIEVNVEGSFPRGACEAHVEVLMAFNSIQGPVLMLWLASHVYCGWNGSWWVFPLHLVRVVHAHLR